MNSLLAVPVYNEESTISSFLEDLIAHLPDQIGEIFIVNDGSSDLSGELIRQFAGRTECVTLLERRVNEGYGAFMKSAFRHAKRKGYDFLITMDCDLQHRPKDLQRFVDYDPQIDIVSGSRYLPDSLKSGEAPSDRVEINARITDRLNSAYNWNITDAFCGFKRYRMEKIDPDFFTVTGYAFPLEFWAYTHRNTMTVRELGVSRIYVTDDRTFGEDLDKKRKRFRYYLHTWREAESRLSSI